MSSIVVSGDTSGSVTLAAPAVAGSTTLTFPSTSGTVAVPIDGTWTPTLAQSGLTISQTNTGLFTKIGRVVTCSMYIQTSTMTGTGSSTITVSGLPYPVANGLGFSCRENAVAGFIWSFYSSAGGTTMAVFRYDNSVVMSSTMSWIASFSYLTTA